MNTLQDFPIISIVTPSYNQGKFIADTIESVISQEGDFYIDYIIMDGASRDNSIEVIQSYSEKLNRCPVVFTQGNAEFRKYGNCKGVSYRWISEKDTGQSNAINKGYKIAVGSIFNWLNSDDKLIEGSLQEVKLVLFDKGQSIVFGGCIAYDHNGKFLWKHNPKEVSVYSMLYRGEGVPQPSVFWKKEITDERQDLVDEKLRYTMDTDLWFYFFNKKIHLYRLGKDLSIQVYHPDSKSNEGESMFEKFKPENDFIKGNFKKSLGFRHYYFSFLAIIEKASNVIYSLFSKICQ